MRLRGASTFRLRSPSAWVLCMVQSAVSGGAEFIKFKQGRRRTDVSFTFPEAWNLERIATALNGGESPSERSANYLITGLQALAVAEGKDVQLKIQIGPALSTYHWGGLNWSLSHSSAKSKDGTTITVSLSHTRTGRAHAQADESRTLLDARVSPIPVYLDRRRVDSYQELSSRVAQKVTLLARGAVPEADETFLSFPAPASLSKTADLARLLPRCTQDRSPQRFREGSDKRLDFIWQYRFHQSFLEARLASKHSSRVEWMVDGVLGTADNLTGLEDQLALTLYLDGSDLQSDASGYSFHQSTRALRRERIERALKKVQISLEEDQDFVNDAILGTSRYGSVYLAGYFGFVLGIVMMPTTPIMLGSWLLGTLCVSRAGNKLLEYDKTTLAVRKVYLSGVDDFKKQLDDYLKDSKISKEYTLKDSDNT